MENEVGVIIDVRCYLPDMCYSYDPIHGRTVCIRKDIIETFVALGRSVPPERLNKMMNLTPLQVEAMEYGSKYGFDKIECNYTLVSKLTNEMEERKWYTF